MYQEGYAVIYKEMAKSAGFMSSFELQDKSYQIGASYLTEK